MRRRPWIPSPRQHANPLRQCAFAAFLTLLLAFTSLRAAETPGEASKIQPAYTSEAWTLIQAAKFPEAEAAARRHLVEVEAASGPRSLETAQALDDLAESLWRQGKGPDPDARAIAARALEIREALLDKDNPRIATSLRAVGIMRNQCGDFAGGVAYFERAVRITEQAYGPDDRRVAMNLNNLSIALQRVGDYAGARAQAERALAIKRRIEKPGGSLASGLSTLAVTLALMGDTEEARRMLEEALAMQERTLPPDDPSIVETIDNLADTLIRMGDLEAARTLAERGLRLRESKLGPDHFHVAYSLLTLGHLETLSGNKDAALAYLGRAIAVREKAFGPAHPWVASALLARGDARDAFGDPHGAREDDERALRIQDQTLDARHPDRAQTVAHLSKALFELGERSHAFDRGLEAAHAAGEHFRATAQAISQSDALRYALERQDAQDVPLSILAEPMTANGPVGGTARAWDQVIRSRAMVLDEMAARHRDLSGQVRMGDVARRALDLNAARSVLADAIGKVPSSGELQAYRDRLTRLYAEKETAERSLAEASAPSGGSRPAPARASRRSSGTFLRGPPWSPTCSTDNDRLRSLTRTLRTPPSSSVPAARNLCWSLSGRRRKSTRSSRPGSAKREPIRAARVRSRPPTTATTTRERNCAEESGIRSLQGSAGRRCCSSSRTAR
jgi:tetratricopeptide (TPR) repeat protein